IDGDDEVALVHAPEELGFRPLTEPLVNIRHNLRRAQKRRIVSARTAALVLKYAKQLHYTARTYDAVLEKARLATCELSELEILHDFLCREAVNLKREDAFALVDAIGARIAGRQAWAPAITVKVNETKYFYRQKRSYAGCRVDGRFIPDALVLSLHKLLSGSFPQVYRRVLRRGLVVDEALHRGFTCANPVALAERFFNSKALRSVSARHFWLKERCLSFAELAAELAERRLVKQIRALYRAQHPGLRGSAQTDERIVADTIERIGVSEREMPLTFFARPGIPWEERLIREMKMLGEFRLAHNNACRILLSSTEICELGASLNLTDNRVERWAASRWGVKESQLDSTIQRRGFVSYAEFLETARLVYSYEISCLLASSASPLPLITVPRKVSERREDASA
ncbi:MAG TPA: TfuA-like protein, partial [Pyrinomonadaceae bacterium]|nr:TfuA-like protein [Pyrinomonadaceae bacterium]